jgi:signal transduction histidine kinase
VVNNPGEADRMLVDFKDQTQAAIGEIRRLVHGLRPPALDQLGLLGALREQANALNVSNGMHVRLEAPEILPTLPAAVEVAAYRIVQEALTNTVRHSQARRCTVWLCLDDALYLAIDDNGAGLPDEIRVGVGLASMRERAEELGGAWRIERRPEGGTRVIARLPMARA